MQSVGGYVQEGLILHLDGINKGGNAGAWTDLVGGKVFSNSGGIEGANHWQLSNGAYLYNSDFVTPSYQTGTIELCLEYDNANALQVVYSTNTSNGIVYFSRKIFAFGGEAGYISDGSGTSIRIPIANKSIVSIVKGRGMYNGQESTATAVQFTLPHSSTYNVIGKSERKGLPFSGKIYAIRLYDRQLTAEEQMQNFDTDNKRFNLGITI